MTETGKIHRPNRKRSWFLILAIFLIVQLIFIAVDGTSLEPKMNDSGNIAGRILESELFTEWLTPYSFPFFNMLTTIIIIYILAKAVKDIFSSIFSRNRIK